MRRRRYQSHKEKVLIKMIDNWDTQDTLHETHRYATTFIPYPYNLYNIISIDLNALILLMTR